MTYRSYSVRSWMFCATFTFILSLICSTYSYALGPYEWSYISLDYARQEKVRQFKRYCDHIHAAATEAASDQALLEFFDVAQKYSRLIHEQSVPEELTQKIEEFREALNEHYIRRYLCFYDVLMVDPDGRVFYTIRHETELQRSLLDATAPQTPLTECLRSAPQTETFIDFHYYAASDEPAAFFVEPVSKNGRPLGWLVLQCAINKVNSLFAGVETLGETGETFLINRDGYMLTESNFEGDSTILKKRLDDRNIRAKFREKQGRRMVTDYRGFSALTSFEVVEFLGVSWLIVAKADEAQVVTEHFKSHRQFYYDKIIAELAEQPTPERREPAFQNSRKIVKVDMDEFVKANHDESLRTIGVSTCTAVVAAYPGKFGYLAHISPLDKAYDGDATNLLGHIIKKIKTYDIYKYERRRVRFVVVARHCVSLPKIVDKLVEEGFLLSQITVLHGPQGSRANVTYDYAQDRITVEWRTDSELTPPVVLHARDAANLGDIVKTMIAGVSDDAYAKSSGLHVEKWRNTRKGH